MPRELATALGRVVRRLPSGGEAREGQREMAEAVARAFAEDHHLVVRAGTGTGKSLGYLVPAVCSGKKVLVATATKALQDQLAEKDLPLVASALPHRFRFAVLKGRANYLCRQRLAEAAASGQQGELGEDDTPAGGRREEQVRRLLQWAARTETGDRAELDEEPEQRVWSAFSVTAEECPGAYHCPSGGECFAEGARARAAEADVVVVNLHLLGADIAAGGTVLPEHEALVVDEAHALEDVLTDSLGSSISPGRLRALAAMARAALGGGRGRAGEAEGAAGDLLEVAERLESALAGRPDERLRPPIGGALGDVLELCAARVVRLESLVRQAQGPAGEKVPEEASQRLARCLLVTGGLRQDLADLAELGDDRVAWVEGGGRPALAVAPIDVAPVLAEQVFSKVPVVLASATVPPGLATRLGAAPERTETLDVGSPFAYEQHALLYCAAHLPDRRRPESERALHDELVALVEAAGGRTLALFTSRAAMARAAEAVAARVAYPVLAQGEASKGALLADFTAEPGACLFATMGFWQGVDVAGPTLACVVIDRIPFPRPDDPLLSARRDRAGPAAFRTVDLPRAASLLAQGAGRLVRTAEDRGVVAVLDSRLATASYRWDLVRALPPMRRTKDRAEAEAFLREIHQQALAREGTPPASSRRARR